MVDQAKLWIRAGNGGDGAVSFRREKFIPKGGPDGGDGGKGGNIYMETDANQNTLDDFAHRQKFEAEDGGKGMGKKMSGGKGDDLIIKIPLGTIVTLRGDSSQVVDFDQRGMRVLVAKGGGGGRGNEHFKSSRNTTPMEAEPGEPGQSFQVEMSLKLLADVGLVGLPNAGKSTLLSVLSNARPKIAEYEFTTLEPNLGVMKSGGKNLVIADIPGLIEGASEGKGLGIKFLKHIERTKVLIHLVAADLQGQALQIGDGEVSQCHSVTGEVVWENYQKIRRELKNYGGEIEKKEEIVVLSKVDLVSEEEVKEIQKYFKKKKINILPISAATQKGMAELKTGLETGAARRAPTMR